MSEVRVKLDENLGRVHLAALRAAGYDAERVHDEGLSGAEDAAVWLTTHSEGRFFITLDLDFGDIRRYKPGSHPGVLLLRPRTKGAQAVQKVLSRVLQQYPLTTLRGCLVVADEARTRIRRPKEA
jgi:predicted nuclease of predicted toxin-antitoxin system